jgi:hypothetical protein
MERLSTPTLMVQENRLEESGGLHNFCTGRGARGDRFLAAQRGVFDRPLDVRISSSLHRRMMERGLAPIPGAVVVEEHKPPLRTPLAGLPPATKFIQ